MSDPFARPTVGATGEAAQPLSAAAFAEADLWSPKFDHWWAFPVCAYEHTVAGNERAVFEEVRHDPSIKKIVLTRSKEQRLEGANVEIAPLQSLLGQWLLMRARQVFVKHGVAVNLDLPLDPRLHNVVNLWHGIPLKRFGFASLDTVGSREHVAAEHARNRAVITSSKVDRLAMTAAFHPMTFDQMWLTGLPRNDFVVSSHDRLPEDLREQERELSRLVGDRKLVLFLPTFRNVREDAYYRFSPDEISWWQDWCRRHDAVLGIREHMADSSRVYSTDLAPLGALDLSADRFPNIEVLYRVSSALVTDYSSCAVDYLLTGRPVVSFAYDLDRYAREERGLFYDLEQVLPGPVARDFGQLTQALEEVFRPEDEAHRNAYERRRALFFDFVDDGSARRVVNRVKGLYSETVEQGLPALAR